MSHRTWSEVVEAWLARRTDAERLEYIRGYRLAARSEEANEGGITGSTDDTVELTVSRAAALLGVSRPHLIKQLEAGAIPSRKVGSHPRVRIAGLLAYRDRRDSEANAALNELTRQAEEFGLYD